MRVGEFEERSVTWWPKLGWLDAVCLGLMTALLMGLCVARSRTRLFWSDETFGFTLLRDPSLARTLHGWWEGADSGGILYYLLGHVWFRLFGATPLSLRLFSTTAFAIAIGVIWVMARRFFAVPVLAMSTALAFFLPSYVLWQEINGRFYGLFLAFAACAVACTMYAVERRQLSRVALVLTCGAHACLIGSHILGLVYSVGLLGALLAWDVSRRRLRPALYGAVVVAWLLVFPISYHSIHATAAIAQGTFWPVRPRWRDLVLGLFAYSHKLVLVAMVLLVAGAGRGWWRSRAAKRPEAPTTAVSQWPIAVALGGLFLAQATLFAKSRAGLSVYADRYLLPLEIAVVLLFGEGLTRALGPLLVRRLSRPLPSMVISVVAIGALFAEGVHVDTYRELYAGLGYPAHVEGLLPPGQNVVVTFLPSFMLLRLFDPVHHYIFATDWAYDGKMPGDFSGQRLLENVSRGGFAKNSVLDCPEVVRELPEFTLLAEPGRLAWLRSEFGRHGEFEVTELGSSAEWYPITIWRVRRLQPNATCASVRDPNWGTERPVSSNP